MMVYAHEVLYNRYEGSWTVKAIYRVKKSAWLAMRQSLLEEYETARNDWYLLGRTVWDKGLAWPYKAYEQQRIKTYELL